MFILNVHKFRQPCTFFANLFVWALQELYAVRFLCTLSEKTDEEKKKKHTQENKINKHTQKTNTQSVSQSREQFSIVLNVRNFYHTSWSSSGTLDNRSNTSLFGTVCGRSRRRENLTQPQSNNRIRIGM